MRKHQSWQASALRTAITTAQTAGQRRGEFTAYEWRGGEKERDAQVAEFVAYAKWRARKQDQLRRARADDAPARVRARRVLLERELRRAAASDPHRRSRT